MKQHAAVLKAGTNTHGGSPCGQCSTGQQHGLSHDGLAARRYYVNRPSCAAQGWAGLGWQLDHSNSRFESIRFVKKIGLLIH